MSTKIFAKKISPKKLRSSQKKTSQTKFSPNNFCKIKSVWQKFLPKNFHEKKTYLAEKKFTFEKAKSLRH